MRVAVIRGSTLNKWEMQNFEPLASEFDITAYGAETDSYPTGDIALPIRRFRPADASFEKMGTLARAAARVGVLKRPSNRLLGLEDALADVELAHAAETSLPFSEQAVEAKQKHGAKVVLTCWETIPFAYEEDLEIHARCCRVRAEADLFLATTARAARALEIEGVAPERIRIVMPGVDTERFVPAPRDPQLLAQYGLSGDELVLLFVGRLIREKGVRELVVAFSLLLKSLAPALARRCRLLIAGNGEQRAFLETLITTLGIGDQAQIIGGMDYMEIHKLHQIADVFVLPSIATSYWEEQYGMVLAEAMSCGTPLVSTRSGGIPEVVGEAGILVPQLEPDALSAALVTLLADTDLREEYRRKARQRAVTCFTAKEVAAQISDAYRAVGQLSQHDAVLA